MATTQIQKDLESGNAAYAASFTAGDLPLPPSKHYVVVTCMDARIHPPSAFGIPLGAAHIIRNAGGSARDALRSLLISNQLLGTTEVLVVKHTGCGMLTFQDADAYGLVEKNLGAAAREEAEGLLVGGAQGKGFLPFGDLEEAVRGDVEFLKTSKVIGGAGVVVSGWVYEVETGRVRKVV